MSLRVWLPLNGSLENKGLDDVTVTNNGATFNSAGKLGGCYKTSNSGDIDLKYSGAQINIGSLSLCGWFKFNKAELTTTWESYSFDSIHPNPTGNLIGNNSYGGVGLIWSTNSLISGAAFTSLYVACSIRSTANGARITNNIIIPFDTWVHLALVFNKSVKALELWLNGELKVTNAMLDFNDAKTDNLKLNYKAVWGGNGPSYNIPFLVNDVRIYDHALSPLEVKQISQGLILHYPLNRNGWGQENLITGTSFIEKNYTYPSSSYQDKFAPITTIIPSGNKYTLSFYAKSTVAGDKIRAHYYSPNTTTTCVSSQGITRTASDGNMDFTLTTDWKLYWVTYTQTETTAKKHIIIPRMGAVGNTQGIVSGTGTVSIKCIKFEEGDKPTPWCPNSSDELYNKLGLNDNMEYDTSGYGNNGTRIGTFSWTSDTPKYQVSTTFDGTNYISTTTPEADILTLSCWVKTSKNKSTSQIIVADSTSQLCISFYSGTIITFYASSGYSTGSKCTLGSAYKENDWNHLVVVKTGTGTRKVYCNGVEQTATSNDYWSSSSTGFTVARRETSTPHAFYGELCDVRAYATALSADDVKSLYNNSAYIDNQGNIYGAVYEEV